MGFSFKVLFLLSLLAFSNAEHVKAYFSQDGVEGLITFEAASEDSTTLKVSLQLGSSQWALAVTEFPVDLLQSNPCTDEQVGQHLFNLTEGNGMLTGNVTAEYNITLGLTSGDQAILGRSVLLTKNSGERVCATIQGDEQVSYTVLNGGVVGYIYFRQVGERMAMFTDLSSAINAAVTYDQRVELSSGSILADQPASNELPGETRCNGLGAAVAEIEDVQVAADGQIAKSYKLFNPTGNVDVVVMTIGDRKICSEVHQYETRQVSTVFSEKGVSGSITFIQTNPFAPTAVHVNLTGLNNTATGWHVHDFPVPYKYDTSNRCGKTGGHFMPFGTGTGPSQNQYEIGDLSGKHGSFSSLNSSNIVYMDHYLPLFGRYSIAGRSIVIHSATERWLCANIGYPGPITVAVARFDAYAIGTITLIQEKDKPWGDTSIHVSLANAGFDALPSEGHNYHVHIQSINSSDVMLDTGRCAGTGGHWNPFAVDLDSEGYAERCAAKLSRCEIGDLSGKFGVLNLGGFDGAIQSMYTDANLPLSSAYSIIGRAITIHLKDMGGPRYTCTNIVEKLQAHARTTVSWSGNGGTAVTGEMKFSETETRAITKFSLNVAGLNGLAGGFHVHEFPLLVSNPGANVCGTTGGHFNPYGAVEPWLPITQDGQEVGDLSRKFGSFAGLDAQGPKTEIDTNLPVSGYQSVVGRSVVIHRDNGTRLRCADVDFDANAMGGQLIYGVVNFQGAITGGIILSQVITNYGVSDVSIHVALENADGTPTEGHGWHVHISPVENGDCLSTDGHYNPFNADVDDDQYKMKCTPLSATAQDYCEVGDLSGKFGKLTIANGVRLVANDPGLSLVGPYSVMGRSIVIHAANGGGPRVACGDIKPLYPGAATVKIEVENSSEETRLKTAFADAIRTYLEANSAEESERVKRVEKGSVYVDKVSVGAGDADCDQYMVHFSGANAANLKSSFQDAVANNAIEEINLCSSASMSTPANISVALFLTVLSLFIRQN